jgi:hypothetical protein
MRRNGLRQQRQKRYRFDGYLIQKSVKKIEILMRGDGRHGDGGGAWHPALGTLAKSTSTLAKSTSISAKSTSTLVKSTSTLAKSSSIQG